MMDGLEYSRLLSITLGTLAIWMLFYRQSVTTSQRTFLTMAVGGFYIYDGIGGAYKIMPVEYVYVYFIFLMSLVSSFCLFHRSFAWVSTRVRSRGWKIASLAEDRRLTLRFVAGYLLVCLFFLFYPEFKVFNLFSPPTPDLAGLFVQRFEVGRDVDTVGRLVGYVKVLLFPFFLFFLRGFRNRPWLFFLLLLLPVYMAYCEDGYVSRGSVLSIVLVGFVVFWVENPRSRKYIIAGSALSFPLLIMAMYAYARVRIGGSVDSNVGVFDALETILEIETTFPVGGRELLDGKYGADLRQYFTWLFTLPFPKVLFGQIEGARINYEIAEIVSGIAVGDRNFSVVLTGVVIESVYIYGLWFFWIHAVTIGLVFAFLCRLSGANRSLVVIMAFFAVQFGYNMNRGGVSSVFPTILNGFLLFYIVSWFYLSRRNRSC